MYLVLEVHVKRPVNFPSLTKGIHTIVAQKMIVKMAEHGVKQSLVNIRTVILVVLDIGKSNFYA